MIGWVGVADAVGWAGAGALLLGYGLLTDHRISATSTTYLLLNLAGSAGLAISGIAHFAWPSVALNLLWLGLGLRSVLRWRRDNQRRRNTSKPAADSSTSGNLSTKPH